MGRLSREDSERIRASWAGRGRRRPQTVSEVAAIATALGFTVERHHAG